MMWHTCTKKGYIVPNFTVQRVYVTRMLICINAFASKMMKLHD